MKKGNKRQGGARNGRQALRKSREKQFGSRQGGKRRFEEVTGKVHMSRDGFVFVVPEGDEKDNDVFVKASKTRGALNGDLVRCVVTREKRPAPIPRGRGKVQVRGGGQRREGEIIEIVERSKTPFVGILHIVGKQAWVLMQSRTRPYDITMDVESLPEGAKKGMKVAAIIDRWERSEPNPHGYISDVLGEPGANETEMHAILAEYGLPYRFAPEVENAADKIPDEITEKDLKGRLPQDLDIHYRPY